MGDTDIDVRGHVAELRHERGECGPDCQLGECENCHWNPVAVTVGGLDLCEKCSALEPALSELRASGVPVQLRAPLLERILRHAAERYGQGEYVALKAELLRRVREAASMPHRRITIDTLAGGGFRLTVERLIGQGN